MRKRFKVITAEIAIFFGGGAMQELMGIAPIWIWSTVAITSLAVLIAFYVPELIEAIERAILRKRTDVLNDLDLMIRLGTGETNWHDTENRVHQEAIVGEFRRLGLFPYAGELPDSEKLKEIRAKIVRHGVRKTARKERARA